MKILGNGTKAGKREYNKCKQLRHIKENTINVNN